MKPLYSVFLMLLMILTSSSHKRIDVTYSGCIIKVEITFAYWSALDFCQLSSQGLKISVENKKATPMPIYGMGAAFLTNYFL